MMVGCIQSAFNQSRKNWIVKIERRQSIACLLYTSDAADERSSVDLGGRRIIKKKKKEDKSEQKTGDLAKL